MLPLLLLLCLGIGCGKSKVDRALAAEARGYFCPKCQAKFYTDHVVFADVCPQCKSFDIVELVGVVCAADAHITLIPRGRGVAACERCGKPASALALPSESLLKAAGAVRKTKTEVSAKPQG